MKLIAGLITIIIVLSVVLVTVLFMYTGSMIACLIFQSKRKQEKVSTSTETEIPMSSASKVHDKI